MTTAPSTTPDDLPQYDDEPRVDAFKLREWLVTSLAARWGPESLVAGATMSDEQRGAVEAYERQLIVDVIGALQVVGDATIVKNPTYRALVRDQRQLEQLAATLTRYGFNDEVVRHDGNIVAAAADLLHHLSTTRGE